EAARNNGAEGVGLCRAGHMFFAPHGLAAMQRMILAETEEERRAALDELLPMQQSDFEEIFTVMDGLPVTIRLLDPPLHEFLPKVDELKEKIEQAETAEEREELSRMLRKANALREANPMLGLRGCRLGILYPEVYE